MNQILLSGPNVNPAKDPGGRSVASRRSSVPVLSKTSQATGSLSATVTTASFDNNNLVQGSGPYASDGVPFTFE